MKSTTQQPLNGFTLIIGDEMDGTFTQAIDKTRHWVHHVVIMDFTDKVHGMDEGIIPNNLFMEDPKAIILNNVDFKTHKQRIKNIVNQEFFYFPLPGNPGLQKLKRPPILICTPTKLDEIPMDIFPDIRPDKIGVLECG